MSESSGAASTAKSFEDEENQENVWGVKNPIKMNDSSGLGVG